MVNFISLPCHVIKHILMQEIIAIEDVMNLGLTCKRLYTAINDNNLWRCKLFQRWPSLREFRADYWSKYENKREMVREGMGYEKELFCCLAFLPFLYNKKKPDEYTGYIRRLGFLFDTWEDAYSLRFHCFHDKLITLAESDPLDEGTNLTNLYCAQRFIVNMRQTDTACRWEKLQNLSDAQQTTEKVATLIAQWCQPHKLVFHSDVAASLDIIVQQILTVLKDVHPTHSIFATSAEEFSSCKERNIDDNYWNAQESRQIIDIIGRVIFREMNFNVYSVNSEETCVDLKMFLIDQVLESKNASCILLQILIQSVSRRLGVRCDLLESSDKLVLCWRESDLSRYERHYYCMDLFSDGSLLNDDDCVIYPSPNIPVYMSRTETLVTPAKLVWYLTTYLDKFLRYTDEDATQSCFVSEFVHMIKRSLGLVYCYSYYSSTNWRKLYYFPFGFDEDSEDELSWSTLFYLDAIEEDLTLEDLMFTSGDDHRLRSVKSDFTDYIFSILSLHPRGAIQSRLGSKHLKYTVGMLVEVESAGFKGAGVIIGWTSKDCNCNHYSPWPGIDHMSEPIMCTPIYTILACGNGKLELCQEFLKPLKMQKWINNSEIGKYFSHFEGTHYVPNQLLRWLYPMDAHILERK